jgi:4-amino-4-deoxy-L-arabinose transferase-like glycosyltransferase
MLKKLLLNRQTPFWLIAISVLIVLTLPTLIQDGMFMDAMLYTSVSHNLSMGIGTFWFPQFSIHNVAGLPSFHEQPPLVFGIQSLFYTLFGDSMYVERFYTFLTMCITALLIIFLWKEIFRNQDGFIKLGWLPLILWITIPVCFWSYSNNMHENTMGIFTLSAVLLIYKSFLTEKFQITLWILSGFTIFLATLSKGLPGFFPITVPFLYWLTIKKNTFSKTFLQTLIITLLPVIIYTILFFIPESKESLSTYLFKRVLHRINEVPTVDNRFYILLRLFMELLPQLSLVVIIFLIAKVKKIKIHFSEQIRESVFFIAVGLSASIPLMLTLVQKGFYFVPSLPFFAIGLSILIAPFILNLTERIDTQNKKYKMFLLLSLLLFISTTTFALLQKGKVSRNKEQLHDIYLIGTIVPRQTTVSIPADMWNDWDLQCYLVRYFNISLETNYQNNYCIINKTLQTDTLTGYKRIDIKTLQYDLYQRQ